MVREAGVEPARPEWTLEPESSESTNSTTRAFRNLSTARVSYHRTFALSTIIFSDIKIIFAADSVWKSRREYAIIPAKGA